MTLSAGSRCRRSSTFKFKAVFPYTVSFRPTLSYIRPCLRRRNTDKQKFQNGERFLVLDWPDHREFCELVVFRLIFRDRIFTGWEWEIEEVFCKALSRRYKLVVVIQSRQFDFESGLDGFRVLDRGIPTLIGTWRITAQQWHERRRCVYELLTALLRLHQLLVKSAIGGLCRPCWYF